MNDLDILQIACGSRFTVVLTDERQRSNIVIFFLSNFFLIFFSPIIKGDSKQHQFEKIQINLPVRCNVCSHFAFGLRHGLWKCSGN